MRCIMDIEQFKLLLETIKSISGDAESVAIWWLVVDKIIPVIACLIAGAGLIYAFKIFLSHLREIEMHDNWLKKMRTILYRESYGYVSDYDLQQMENRINDLLAKEKSLNNQQDKSNG